jgi:hypothetical protein
MNTTKSRVSAVPPTGSLPVFQEASSREISMRAPLSRVECASLDCAMSTVGVIESGTDSRCTSGSSTPALVYTAEQVCAALQISAVTLWRLERRGLLKPLPHLRHKRYAVRAVERFANS